MVSLVVYTLPALGTPRLPARYCPLPPQCAVQPATALTLGVTE